jgi:hypothetical protein
VTVLIVTEAYIDVSDLAEVTRWSRLRRMAGLAGYPQPLAPLATASRLGCHCPPVTTR